MNFLLTRTLAYTQEKIRQNNKNVLSAEYIPLTNNIAVHDISAKLMQQPVQPYISPV